MKFCSGCKIEKPLSHFTKQNANRDGLDRWCKECKATYRKTYVRSEEGKEIDRLSMARYGKTPEGIVAYKRAHDKYLVNNYDKHLSRSALNNAIRYGRLIKPNTCEYCGFSGCLHGHHTDYSKPLDVQWLCVPCHTIAHHDLFSCEQHF